MSALLNPPPPPSSSPPKKNKIKKDIPEMCCAH